MPVSAETKRDWRAWRGPHGHGSVESGNFPDSVDAKHLKWKADLPGKGCSTPILLGENIFLTAPSEGKDSVLCIDTQGKQKWITRFDAEDAGKHRNGSGSNASPVTDGD